MLCLTGGIETGNERKTFELMTVPGLITRERAMHKGGDLNASQEWKERPINTSSP